MRTLLITFMACAFFADAQITRIGALSLYEMQSETLTSDTLDLVPQCVRVIIKSEGTDSAIRSVIFGNGGNDNRKVSFVIYNGGTSALKILHLDSGAAVGNKINCFGATKILNVGEHGDMIYNTATGQYDFFK